MSYNVNDAGKSLIGAVLTVMLLGFLLGSFTDTIDDMRIGNSIEFNNTMDDMETYAWIGATFMAVGILIFAGKNVLSLTEDF